MPKFFVKNNQIKDDFITIFGDDVNHITNVLRMKNGEMVNICDIDTCDNFSAEIQEITKQEVICKIIEKLKSETESDVYIHIIQGLPKADKMELIIQKSTELGVKEITPLEMKRCVVKLNEKDGKKKIERWQKIAEVASKQSGRDIIPKINEIKNIKNIYENLEKYDIVIVAYENEKQKNIKTILKQVKQKTSNPKIAIIIGPEGGIDEEEIKELEKKGASVITLGNRILRTETVALALASIIMYEFEGEV